MRADPRGSNHCIDRIARRHEPVSCEEHDQQGDGLQDTGPTVV